MGEPSAVTGGQVSYWSGGPSGYGGFVGTQAASADADCTDDGELPAPTDGFGRPTTPECATAP